MVYFFYFCEKLKIMQVVSAREFRANQTKILAAAQSGQTVLLTSRIGNFKIVPITNEDTIVKRDIVASLEEVKAHMNGTIDLPNARDIEF
jgi:antitoxin (DNA-binding transcriptional repressor) of toxin-antitoxin stability system